MLRGSAWRMYIYYIFADFDYCLSMASNARKKIAGRYEILPKAYI